MFLSQLALETQISCSGLVVNLLMGWGHTQMTKGEGLQKIKNRVLISYQYYKEVKKGSQNTKYSFDDIYECPLD